MGRGLIIVLVISLALNVFAVGFYSGRVISGDGPPPHKMDKPGRPDHPMALLSFARELPPEIRREFRGKIREQLPSLRENHGEVVKIRMELANLLSEEEYDRDAVAAKFVEMNAIQDSQRAAFNEAFLDALETLPPEERRRMIERAMEREANKGPRKRRRFREGEE